MENYGKYAGITNHITWTVYNTSNSDLPDAWISTIAIDNNNQKWIGTQGGGLVKFDGSVWTVYNTSNSSLPDNDIRTIAIDDSNHKWIGTWGSLVKFDGRDWTVYDNLGGVVTSIAIDESNQKWIACGSLVVYREGGIISSAREELKRNVLPDNYRLSQNYPNPFNPTTVISYYLAKSSTVEKVKMIK